MRFFCFLLAGVISSVACYTAHATNNNVGEQVNRISNSSLTPVANLIPQERALVEFHRKFHLEEASVREEIFVNGQSYRLSCVPGDNDCGVHAINAHYPHLKLTRKSILKRLGEIIDNPNDPHHNLVRRELANDLVMAIKQIFVGEFEVGIGNIGAKQFADKCLKRGLGCFLGETNFLRRLGADLFVNDLPFISEAYNNMPLLLAHLRYLQNQQVLLLALPQTEGYMGTFGMLCRVYDVSISLLNYANKGVMPVLQFLNSKNDPSKFVLFRRDHFSPLCLMDDVEERKRLASHHISQFVLTSYFQYENVKLSPQERIALQVLVGVKAPEQIPRPKQVTFDPDTYLRLNEGLAAYARTIKSDAERRKWALKHYVEHGRHELRMFLDLPAGFHPLTYISLYQDLRDATAHMQKPEQFAWGQTHYVNFGHGEKRLFAQLPNDFDPLRYLDSNPDLKQGTENMSETQKVAFGQSHYVRDGIKEKRSYK